MYTGLWTGLCNSLCLSLRHLVARAALLTGRLPIRNGFYTTNAHARNCEAMLARYCLTSWSLQYHVIWCLQSLELPTVYNVRMSAVLWPTNESYPVWSHAVLLSSHMRLSWHALLFSLIRTHLAFSASLIIISIQSHPCHGTSTLMPITQVCLPWKQQHTLACFPFYLNGPWKCIHQSQVCT